LVGLKEELRGRVKLDKPVTIVEAYGVHMQGKLRFPAYKGYQANPANSDLGIRVQKTDTERREKPSISTNT